MADNNIFEVATRGKMRFQYNGMVTVEDLWDLSVEQLDAVFKTLNAAMKQVQEESLLDTRSQADRDLDVKIALVKHIVAVKLKEKDERAHAREQREKRQRLLEVLASKKDEALRSKTAEELEAMIAELD